MAVLKIFPESSKTLQTTWKHSLCCMINKKDDIFGCAACVLTNCPFWGSNDGLNLTLTNWCYSLMFLISVQNTAFTYCLAQRHRTGNYFTICIEDIVKTVFHAVDINCFIWESSRISKKETLRTVLRLKQPNKPSLGYYFSQVYVCTQM